MAKLWHCELPTAPDQGSDPRVLSATGRMIIAPL